MFFASFVLAGLQVVGALAVFALARRRLEVGLALAFMGGLFAIFLVPSMFMFFSPAAFFHFIALAIIGIVCLGCKARQIVFAALALAATFIVIGLAGWSGPQSWSELKERYPFESITERLAYETKAAESAKTQRNAQFLHSQILPEATLTRLKEAEDYRRWSWTRRVDSLRLVHASHVEQFIASPGFGVARMPLPSPYSIGVGEERARALYDLDRRPDLEGSPDPGAENVSTGDNTTQTASAFAAPLGDLHDNARNDFLDPEAFGYVRDRDHVAGFVPHSFLNELPHFSTGESHRRWLTVRVELVSLLKHDRPMVYASEHLPSMTELSEAPLRDLDAFEQQAIASLLQGEDIVSDAQIGHIRALGSLRAMNHCLECHEVPRGTLLGAFSYEFLRDAPAPRRPDKGRAIVADEGKLL